MAGLALTTDLERDRALSAAVQAARDLGFEVSQWSERQFRAKRGSLAVSWLLPPVVAYCNFLVSVMDGEDHNTEIVVERNTPWWTGYFGVRGVQAQFDSLAAKMEDVVLAFGGKALRWRHF